MMPLVQETASVLTFGEARFTPLVGAPRMATRDAGTPS